jgi:hypothetical protein
MKRRNVKDLREKGKGTFKDDDVDKHQSYAMVSISRQSWGNGATLFGSKIKHNNILSLKISHAERNRNKYYEHYFSKKQIIEVLMSPAQFTSMLTMMNTSGSPCTLSWLNGESIEPPPDHDTIDELKDDLAEKYNELANTVRALKADIDGLLKGTVKKADKDAIKSAVHQIYNDVSSNILYLRKCQHEKLETTVAEAKAEVESAMVTTLINAGIEHIKAGDLEITSMRKIGDSDE